MRIGNPSVGPPPDLTKQASRLLGEVAYATPSEDTASDMEPLDLIASNTDVYIESAGNIFADARFRFIMDVASGAYTMAPEVLCFSDIAHPDLLSYSRDMAEFGFKSHVPAMPELPRRQVYANATDNPDRTASELWADLANGRLFLLSVASVPYTGNLMGANRTFVSQQGVTNPDVIKTRYTIDRRLEVNTRVRNEIQPTLVIPKHQNVARMLLYWKRRYPAAPIVISKRDARGACRLVPISVRGMQYIGCMFSSHVGMYFRLIFWRRESTSSWSALSGLVKQYVAAHRPYAEFRVSPVGFIAYQYVGDGAFIYQRVGLRPRKTPILWECVLRRSLRLEAVNKKINSPNLRPWQN